MAKDCTRRGKKDTETGAVKDDNGFKRASPFFTFQIERVNSPFYDIVYPKAIALECNILFYVFSVLVRCCQT